MAGTAPRLQRPVCLISGHYENIFAPCRYVGPREFFGWLQKKHAGDNRDSAETAARRISRIGQRAVLSLSFATYRAALSTSFFLSCL